MAHHLMAYNKDDDRYDELASDDCGAVSRKANELRHSIGEPDLVGADGEPYDWLEIWDDEDDNGVNDVIITKEEKDD